jgi:ligand-binding SRPBCC domain-containing protein
VAVFQLYKEQKIPAGVEAIWDFISSPGNLKHITPAYMGFDITSENLSGKMHPGMIIMYKVSPVFGINMKWVTEITHVVDRQYFVDEQRIGPYKIWHHQHRIQPVKDGVLMTDLVTYKPPMGFIGALANRFFIRKKLDEIFDFRRERLIQIFGDSGE